MALLFIVATPFVTVLSTSVVAQRYSRERTMAEQAAMTQIESIRSQDYTTVGTPNGNPNGTVPASSTISLRGTQGTLKSAITYVSDPTPNGYVTKADYKKVVVTVLRTKDSKQLAREVTYIAPPGDGSFAPAGQAIVIAQVVDYALNSALQGATVNLTTGPSAPRSDVTDASGTATFPDLTINPSSGSQAYYDLAPTLSGYQTLPDDVSPSGTAHVALTSGQTFNTVLRMFQPATIYVTLNNNNGTAYSGAATVTVSSPRKAQTFAYSGSTLTITSLNGEAIVPSLTYTVGAQTATNVFAPAVAKVVPSNYPSVLTQSFTDTLGASASTMQSLTLTVKTAAGATVSGARVDVTNGPLPAILTGTTNGSGVVVFNVPSGNSYNATATSSSGLTGTWGVHNVTSTTTGTVTVS